MLSSEIRQKFLDFFKQRGHAVIPSASLVPENDPSVLFTTAGMQQFKSYYIGKKDAQKDFQTLNLTSSQKCVRTSDIEEVGDESHLTFFEMLGNFSFGGYWKKEAIEYAHELITKDFGLKIDYISVFSGENNVPKDTESTEIWKSIDPNLNVKKFGRKDNFWGPTGEEGPCGPTTEIYVDGIEVWNVVFNEYYQSKDGTLKPLEVKGVDTGMGLERLVRVIQKVPTVFETDLFSPIIKEIEDRYGVADIRIKRIIADHARTSVFMIADGVVPSNTDRGYVLRRLIRRSIFQAYKFARGFSNLYPLIDMVIAIYRNVYPELENERKKIHEVFETEEIKFMKTLEKGLKEFNWRAGTYAKGKLMERELPPSVVFELVTTYGFPFELVEEEAHGLGMIVDKTQFQNRMEAHRLKSRTGGEQKFKK